MRTGLRTLLGVEPDFEVVGEAADGAAALRAVTELVPDVVLMDIRMPVLDGIAATEAIVSSGSPSRICTLTTYGLDQVRTTPSAALLLLVRQYPAPDRRHHRTGLAGGLPDDNSSSSSVGLPRQVNLDQDPVTHWPT